MATIQNVQKLRGMYGDVEDNVSSIKGSIQQVDDQQEALNEEIDAIEDAVMNELTKKMRAYLYGKAYIFELGYITFKGFWKGSESYAVNDVITIPNDLNGEQYVCIQAHTSSESNEPGTAGGASYWTDAPPLSTTQVVLGGTFGNTNIAGGIVDWIIQEELMSSASFPALPTPYWSDAYIYGGVGWDGDQEIEDMRSDWLFAHDYINKPLGTGASPATYGLRANVNALEGAKEILNNNSNKIKDSKGVFAKYVQPQS